MKLAALLVFVPDLAEAQDFYARILGLVLIDRSDTSLSFALGPAELHVFRCDGDASRHRHGQDASTAIAFDVASIETEMTRLRAEGVCFLHDQPAINAELRVRYAAFVAPGGNIHELMERF
jgi:catechol 2,3-dioxygenase-like lactoylglutathione lyase family enzyme